MYFLLKTGIYCIAMLVYQSVFLLLKKSLRRYIVFGENQSIKIANFFGIKERKEYLEIGPLRKANLKTLSNGITGGLGYIGDAVIWGL